MENKLRKVALENLAKTAGEFAKAAIMKELCKINAALGNENEFEQITTQLEFLGVIAHRVPEEALTTIKKLLVRLESIELTHEKCLDAYMQDNFLGNRFTLIVKALEILESIRYYKIKEILEILLEYSCHEEESVANEAMLGIKKISGFDLWIFNGDGKDFRGLGCSPQEKILEKLGDLDSEKKLKYFNAITAACEQMLLPNISGRSYAYNAVTIHNGVLPASLSVKKIRERTLSELQQLYKLTVDVAQKRTILGVMETATHMPHLGEYGNDVIEMIVENSVFFTKFLKTLVNFDNMELMQKIENDAYWLYYRTGSLSEPLSIELLEIRDALYSNEDYQRFRILIGFESIFHDWDKGTREIEDFELEKKVREEKAQKMAESINLSNYFDWKKIIISYASIKSNDLATFPHFGKFLESFGRYSPELALRLVNESFEQLENFVIAIFCGVATTEKREDLYSLIENWSNAGLNLFCLARFFEYSSETNEGLLKKILAKAIEVDDQKTLIQIISVVSAKYDSDNKHLLEVLFIPALKELTRNKVTEWIFAIWFRKQRKAIFAEMDKTNLKLILSNLLWLKSIDFHAEEILYEIAEKSPELVIQYFCNRLAKNEDHYKYDAIPFSFSKLQRPLSIDPKLVIKAILDNFDGNYGFFIFRGAKFLSNIFPDFPPDFQQNLIKLVQSRNEKNILFVMAILRNYEGNPFISKVCKEIVKILPEESDLLNELEIILQNTGVVCGEYGFVDAYKRKLEEIQSWSQDENTKVKEFTKRYIERLERQIAYEKKRADEDVILRKYKYGESKS